jgi:heat shock protein HtpX
MPDIYIIDDPALNAFATGRDPKRASVAVTSGLLARLNRDELQGVIGHEMAHIKNRDVLLMAVTAVLLGTIVMLAYGASRMMLFGGGNRRSSSGGGGSGGAIILILALVLIILAPIAAQLIYFAISRKREYLADASSALYTRYPEGLASALEKLGASTTKLQSANQATAAMYTINPLQRKGLCAADLTSTHPPISERVRILRSMGGASYAAYNKAFSNLHKGQGVIGAATMAAVGAGAVGLREASAEAAPLEEKPAAKAKPAKEPTKAQRTRETSDLMWRMNGYKPVNCECGVNFWVPPNYKHDTIRCPHCSRINKVGV